MGLIDYISNTIFGRDYIVSERASWMRKGSYPIAVLEDKVSAEKLVNEMPEDRFYRRVHGKEVEEARNFVASAKFTQDMDRAGHIGDIDWGYDS